jgi:hypothetical protein
VWRETVPAQCSPRHDILCLILLPHTLPVEDARGIIAHEIASLWKRRRQRRALPRTLGHEVAVAKLVRQWGFTGSGADVAEYQRDADQWGSSTVYS